MGTYGLELYDTADFWDWVFRSGYKNEFDFWSSLSSINNGTTYDHMVNYLSSLGYSGSPHDMFRKFLEGQVGNLGTIYDMATVFYEGTWGAGAGGGGGDSIVDADGNIIVDADGNFIVDGG